MISDLKALEKSPLDLLELLNSSEGILPNKCDIGISNLVNCRYGSTLGRVSKRSDCLRTLHLNIQGLSSSLDQLKRVCEDSSRPDILGICETFATEQTDLLLELLGYDCEKTHRKRLSKGRLALYVSKAIPYTVRHDLSKNIEGVLESLFVEINPGKSGTLIIGDVYRSPSGSSVTFLQILREILKAIQNQPCETVAMGDFNVNLLDYEGSFPANFLSDIPASGLLPSVTMPTRVTEKSANLIDNIFSSMTFQNSLVIASDISDHFPVISDLLLPNMQAPRSSPSTSPYFITENNLEALKTKLQECQAPAANTTYGKDTKFLLELITYKNSKLIIIYSNH